MPTPATMRVVQMEPGPCPTLMGPRHNRPILVGWYPRLMDRRVGPVNLAYLFALSQFVVAWLLAFLYVRVAARFDRMSADILGAAGTRREPA